LFIKDGFDYMRRCDENTALSNEEASSDRSKKTIVLLRHDWEDGVAKVGLRSVARLG